eukprot:SAG31_NODE_416_length_15934_cov_7.384970_15_plen_402_part_00
MLQPLRRWPPERKTQAAGTERLSGRVGMGKGQPGGASKRQRHSCASEKDARESRAQKRHCQSSDGDSIYDEAQMQHVWRLARELPHTGREQLYALLGSTLVAPTPGYLAEFSASPPGVAGGGLFFDGHAPQLTRLQAAALRLAWASGAHPRLGAACAANSLIEDLVCSVVSESLQSHSVVVRNVKALRAAVTNDGVSLIELDPTGTFDIGGRTIKINRTVKLVSGVGGRARLTHRYGNGFDADRDSPVVSIDAEGVVLEGLAFAVRRSWVLQVGEYAHMYNSGEAVLRGCDLKGRVTVYGMAEFHECVVHDSDQYGVVVNGARAKAVLVSSTVEHCHNFGVYVTGGVASLQGKGNTVRACRVDGNHMYVVDLDSGGLIEGVAPELVGHLEDSSDGEEEDDY